MRLTYTGPTKPALTRGSVYDALGQNRGYYLVVGDDGRTSLQLAALFTPAEGTTDPELYERFSEDLAQGQDVGCCWIEQC